MAEINTAEIIFIINPNSGRRQAEKTVKSLEELEVSPSFIVTKNIAELDRFFKENIDNYKVFIAVGGDGTVNEIAKHLCGHSDKIFGILPTGSGNGFAREMGFKKSLEHLLNSINKGEIIETDVLQVNNNLCINAAGLGFDSYVAHQFSKGKKRGLKRYVYHTLKSMLSFQPFFAKVQADDVLIEGKFQMLTIANTRQFGNNARIAPMAKPNDGIFELVTVRNMPIYKYPGFIVRMFSGRLKETRYLKFYRVKARLQIESDYKMYHIDGEPKTFDTKVLVKMSQQKIRVLDTRNIL